MSDLLRRHGPKVAVGGLLAVNVVLIGALALRDPVSSAVPAVPVPTLSPSYSPTADTSSSPRPSATASQDDPGDPPAPPPPSRLDSAKDARRLLAASSARVAWRAEQTGCGEVAAVEVTTNGGRSWRSTAPGLTAIVRLKAYGNDAVFAVGADRNCRVTYAWITGPSERWQRDRSRARDVWYRTPGDLDLVHAPGGAETRPCGDGLIDLAGLGTSRAAALCADGRIRTEAQGRSWRTVRRDSGAVSLNADDAGFVAAVRREPCDGLVLQQFDSEGSGLSGRAGRCETTIGSASDKAVVARRYDNVWWWVDDRAVAS